MGKADKHMPTLIEGDKKSSFNGYLITLQFLDTSWRVALPIIVFSLIGHKIDQQQNSGPLFLMLGFFVSLPIMVLLIYRQLKGAYPDMFNSKREKNS